MSGRESNRAAADGGGDRISWLPNEVLHRILSFLPSRDAVQTSVLARRWCYFWKSSRRLSIIHPWTSDSEPVSRSGDQSAVAVDRLNRFVNCLLLRRDHVPLDECKLSFDGFRRVDGDQVDEWIRHALSWEVPVLLVHLGTNVQTELRGQRFVSAHLKKLELSEVKFKESILDFSSCTALEDVMMRSCVICVENIFSPSLKQLKITYCNFDFGVITRISVPCLLTLELAYCSGQTPLFESMPTLETAFVTLGWFQEDYCGKGIAEDQYGEGTDEGRRLQCTTYCAGAKPAQESTGVLSDFSTDPSGSSLCENGDLHWVCRKSSGSADPDERLWLRPCYCGVCANCCGNDNSRSCVLLGGLSSVRYLRMDPSSQMFTIKRDMQCCPVFSNLRTLELVNWNLNIGLQDLLCFLKYTPLLQKLVVKVPKQGDPYHVNRAFFGQITESLRLPHLKVVEVSYRKDGYSVCVWELLNILELCGSILEQCNIIRIL